MTQNKKKSVTFFSIKEVKKISLSWTTKKFFFEKKRKIFREKILSCSQKKRIESVKVFIKLGLTPSRISTFWKGKNGKKIFFGSSSSQRYLKCIKNNCLDSSEFFITWNIILEIITILGSILPFLNLVSSLSENE